MPGVTSLGASQANSVCPLDNWWKTKLGEMQRSTNQARCNPSISLLHFYYSHSSHYSYCITNWLVARILYNLAHFLGIAHARSGCIALRPSTITLATPSEKWSFLMIVLRDHGQFSRDNPPPLPTPLPGGHWELQRFSSLHSYCLILCGEVMSMHCCEEVIRFFLQIVLAIGVA